MKHFAPAKVPPGWPNLLMKKLLALVLPCAIALSASAQLFRPEVVNGAVLGGLAGAVIGHNDGRHGWEGAAYGAAAGAVLGAIVGEANDQRWHGNTQVRRPVVYRDYSHRPHGYRDFRHRSYGPRYDFGPAFSVGYGYHPGHRYGGYPRAPRSFAGHYPRSYYGGYDYGYVSYGSTGSDRVIGGTLLGAGIGAIIGHNNGRRGWEGAAYGALAGAVLGSVTDRSYRADYPVRSHRRVVGARYYEQPEVVVAHPQAAASTNAQPQQVTIINNYYAPTTAPMSSANALFGR